MISLLLLTCVAASSNPTQTNDLLLELGHPAALRVVGAEAVPADVVRRALLHDHDFFEASHPTRETDAYRSWLKNATTAGYQHAGFMTVEVEVHVDRERSRVEVRVTEGPRLIAAEVEVEGASVLDVEWVRAVLRCGSTEQVAREHLPAPAGPPSLEPALPSSSGTLPPPPFWVPGRPAPLAALDRERFERLSDEAARTAGLRAAQVSVSWKVEGERVTPVVVIEEEGPVATIDEIRFEGVFDDPEEMLLEWIGARPGTPATKGVLMAAVDRLQATGRFGGVGARYDPFTGDDEHPDLLLRLEQAPETPALVDHPFAEMALLRRAMLRLMDPSTPQVGLEVELAVSPELTSDVLNLATAIGLSAAEPGERITVIARLTREEVAIELSRNPAEGAATLLARFEFDENGGALHCPPLGLEVDFPAPDWRMMLGLQASYGPPRPPSGRSFNMSLNGGIRSRRRSDTGSPVSFSLRVSPSALLNLLVRGDVPTEIDDDRLERVYSFEIGDARVSVERADARLLVEANLHSEQGAANMRFGQLGDRQRRESGTAGPDDPEPSGSMAVDPLLAALEVAREMSPDANADIASPELILVLTGLRAILSELWSANEQESSPPVEFSVMSGPAPTDPTASMRMMAERGALSVIESQGPGGYSWVTELVRAAPLLFFPASRDEQNLAGRSIGGGVAGDPNRGPLGAWLAAEMCTIAGQKQWARQLASLGREDLSTASFLRDVETLIDADSAKRVANEWRELKRLSERTEDPSAGTNGIGPAGRELVRATFGGITTSDPDSAWLRAGMTRLWGHSLRAIVERRLTTIETAK